MLAFEDRENWRTPRKPSRSKDKNQQQTRPIYDAESENRTRATLVGDECSQCARHRCFPIVQHIRQGTNQTQTLTRVNIPPPNVCLIHNCWYFYIPADSWRQCEGPVFPSIGLIAFIKNWSLYKSILGILLA